MGVKTVLNDKREIESVILPIKHWEQLMIVFLTNTLESNNYAFTQVLKDRSIKQKEKYTKEVLSAFLKNVDESLFDDKVGFELRELVELFKNLHGDAARHNPEPQKKSRSEIILDLKESFEAINLLNEGKIESRDLYDLLNEL